MLRLCIQCFRYPAFRALYARHLGFNVLEVGYLYTSLSAEVRTSLNFRHTCTTASRGVLTTDIGGLFSMLQLAYAAGRILAAAVYIMRQE